MKGFILSIIGGVSYFIIEILWRGYSHFSMFMLGGLCFLFIGLINEFFTYEMPLWKQQGIATIIIIFLELIFGLILNIWLNLNIWDYSNLRFNFMGQICLEYSILWFFLSLPAIVLDDYIRYKMGEEKPHYVFF